MSKPEGGPSKGKKAIKIIYKTLRTVIFSVTLFIVGLYILAYVLLSIPSFTNMVKDRACEELSTLLGGKVEIDELGIFPFNEATVKGLKVYEPNGEKCIEIETVGAGIRLWKLLYEGKIEITYAEIIGLDARLRQEEKDSPLNINFIIEALKSKDDNKEKKEFELALKNVVLRKSSVSFERPWLKSKKLGEIDLGNLRVNDLAADLTFPKISDKEVEVDLRRLSLTLENITTIEKLGLKGKFSENEIEIKDLEIIFPSSQIQIAEILLKPEEGQTLSEYLETAHHHLALSNTYFTPSDFSALYPPLKNFKEPMKLNLDVSGNIDEITIDQFSFGNDNILNVSFYGNLINLRDPEKISGNISQLRLEVSKEAISRITPSLNGIPAPVEKLVGMMGNISLQADIAGSMKTKTIDGHLNLLTDIIDLAAEGSVANSNGIYKGGGEVNINRLMIQEAFPQTPFGNIKANVVAQGSVGKGVLEGDLSLVVDDFEYKGRDYEGFSLELSKDKDYISGNLFMDNELADIEADFEGDLTSVEKRARLDLTLTEFNPSNFVDMKNYNDYTITCNLALNAYGTNIDDIRGDLSIEDLDFVSPDRHRQLNMRSLKFTTDFQDSERFIDLRTDWVDARAEGQFKLQELPGELAQLTYSVFPILDNRKEETHREYETEMDFDILVKKDNTLIDFFKLPITMLVPLEISGNVSGSLNSASLDFNLPYLQQGKDKLIYDSRMSMNVDGNKGVLDAVIESTVPVKNGDLELNIDLFCHRNNITTDLRWLNTANRDFTGHVTLSSEFAKNSLTHKPEIFATILPSVLRMGTADWHLSESHINYADNTIKVDGLRIWHGKQFVEINGVVSSELDDIVKVELEDIDVDYIFDTLRINYVTFGGVATGEISGRALLSGNPVAETESLKIDKFTYNGADLGECVVSSRWVNEQKKIEIAADISQNGHQTVKGAGGIWLTRDSLCFDIAADKVPVGFVQPFMAVFSSHVGGYATGAVKLFGNFHDIDMTGKIFADSVAVKLDYTNTVYHGSDSVFLNPGKIEIPNFRLYDKYNNSALLTGELKHRYFHDPSFTFRLSDANNFLCYDTSSELNPDWYGVLFGSGSAFINGIPGSVDISADMTVGGNSSFTFVLNDTQYAHDYQFLTFSDKKKEEQKRLEEANKVPDIRDMFRKKVTEEKSYSRFGIDLRATVTPQVYFTLVMDPAAGDKITARGNGALQLKYESDNDDITMYGKYAIEEGNYNFSLQDIILRDFKIKEGSSISFNGNPLTADLDISATYRVNTNLSDLDKSFSTDRDLNRTNVPVDAVLSVDGNMENPNITFDIELPTLTQDVERKVKSIISTDDMMNRQIIYLLALNRFYTPEYMGVTGNGGELAAVASSTISSQLSNILGQLSDRFSVAPSFRSDKGDFSDIEVDVALSSRLLNNRLLINGNFGYRDKNTSSTTFVGDFDIEYLLSKNGNLRLKAYNHFNDQNYYLREALTTQGLGIVYRRDFDDWFTFLKKHDKKTDKPEDKEEEPDDSETQKIEDPQTDGTQD